MAVGTRLHEENAPSGLTSPSPIMGAETYNRGRILRRAKAFAYIFLLLCIFLTLLSLDNGIVTIGSTTKRGAQPQYVQAIASNRMENALEKHNDHKPASPALDPADVLIMVKTGATKLWQRLPIHLSTTLSNETLTPNIAFYSDFPTTIATHPIIDSLANASSTLKSSPDFHTWHGIRAAVHSNRYLDQQGDESLYVDGAWRLDKYKFVPMVAHAARNYPGKQWYVFMEDDTFYFWESLYAWLATFDADEAVFVGGPAARLGEDFAHGGSGFALSRGAVERVFGAGGAAADARALEKWDEYSLDQCCGDQVLAHVLASKGVKRRKDFEGTGLMPLQGLPLWQMGFGSWNWCSPLFTVHKVHAEDVSTLWAWEREFKAKKGGSVRYKDVFTGLVESKLSDIEDEWDNFAEEKHYSSSMEESEGEKLTEKERSAKPWFNKANCEKACQRWDQCLQWRYADDHCYHSSVVVRGRRVESGIKMTSGWMLKRIKQMKEKQCDALSWPEL